MLCPHCQQIHPTGTQFCPFTAQPIPQSAIPAGGQRFTQKIGLPVLITGLLGVLLLLGGLCGLLGQAAYETAGRWLDSNARAGTGEQDSQLTPLADGFEPAIIGPATLAAIRAAATSAAATSEAATQEAASLAATPAPGLSNVDQTQTAQAGQPPSPSAAPSATQANTPIPTPTLTSIPAKAFSGWFAYVYGEDNQREVYLMNPDSGETRQVTHNEYSEEWPTFSPDNRYLAFASYRQENWQIYVVELASGIEKQLTQFNGQARYPQWSPRAGSTQIVFEGRVGSPGSYDINIFMVDFASNAVKQLTFSNADSRPRWSPDGTRLVVGRATADTNKDGAVRSSDSLDPYFVVVDTGQETRFVNSPDSDDFEFAWSPDGRTIAVASVRQDVDGNGAINLDDAQGLYLLDTTSGAERYLPLNGLHIFSPDYSADGTRIIMTADVGSSNEIWLYDLQHDTLQRISSTGPYFHTEWAN
jgi:dipeptidyl aminopeptidase/acylaminoacyl peptidase